MGISWLSKLKAVRLLEERARQNADRYRSIFENALDGIILTSLDGKCLDANPAYARIHGYQNPEDLIANVSDVGAQIYADPDDRSRILPELIQKGSLRYEYLARRKDGSVFWVSVSSRLVRDNDGQPSYFESIVEDISERKNLEISLKNYALKLERSNQELEQFAFIASHDLKQPLNTISIYLQILMKQLAPHFDEDTETYAKHIVRASMRLNQLVSDLLLYCQIGKEPETSDMLDTNEVVKDVLSDLNGYIVNAKSDVVVHPLPKIKGQRSLIAQVFQNLIENAVKFRRHEPLHIEISSDKLENFWRFSVEDNGIGIEKRHFEKIFVLFQRLHRYDDYPGTGLGLSICKKIVENEGGNLWVESIPGRGSRFSFTLPA